MPDTDPLAQRRHAVRMLALAVAALMAVTIVLSAAMRLSQAGLGCEPWPACFGQAAAQATSATGLALARLLHRAAASIVLVLVIVLVLATLTLRPRLVDAGRVALTLLLLTLLLALLGATMRGSTAVPVVLGNLLGGFLMLAFAVRLGAPAPAPVRWARVGLALLLLQIVLGGLISATQATLATDDRLQLLHRALALLLLGVLAPVVRTLLHQRQRAQACMLAALLVLQGLVGGLLAPAGWPLAQVLAHNLGAALLLAVLLRLA